MREGVNWKYQKNPSTGEKELLKMLWGILIDRNYLCTLPFLGRKAFWIKK